MKHLFVALLLLSTAHAHAQEEVTLLTMLNEFQPATILLTTGKKLKTPLANIFLKNAALLYKSGDKTMQANMSTIVSVQFDKRHFVKLEKQLAEVLFTDTNGNRLLRISTIDMEAYQQMLQNANVITSLSLNESVSMTTTELIADDDRQLPLLHSYYFTIGGRTVAAQERQLKRTLNKEQRHQMESQLARKDFSWTSEASLTKLLQKLKAEK